MDKQLTNQEAWADFYKWLKNSDRWKTLSAKEKNMLGNTGRAVKTFKCGSARINKAFEQYRPGVYVLSETWYKKVVK